MRGASFDTWCRLLVRGQLWLDSTVCQLRKIRQSKEGPSALMSRRCPRACGRPHAQANFRLIRRGVRAFIWPSDLCPQVLAGAASIKRSLLIAMPFAIALALPNNSKGSRYEQTRK